MTKPRKRNPKPPLFGVVLTIPDCMEARRLMGVMLGNDEGLARYAEETLASMIGGEVVKLWRAHAEEARAAT